MIKIRVVVSNLALALSCGFAYADVVFDGRFSEGDFSRYGALEADGAFVRGALAPHGVSSRSQQVLDPAGSGKSVALATLLLNDAPTNGGYRSEMSAFKDPLGSERWYSWGYYLPDTFKTVKNDIVIAQIHNTPDEGETHSRNPTLAVLFKKDRLILINAFDSDSMTSRSGTAPKAGVDYERRHLTSWPLETGKWIYLDLHVKWAANGTGSLEFWKDGVLLFQEKNHINTFNDERGVWFKNGVYDFSSNPGLVSTYSTGVKIGDEKETFRSMTMSTVPEPSAYSDDAGGLVAIGFTAYRRQQPLSGVR